MGFLCSIFPDLCHIWGLRIFQRADKEICSYIWSSSICWTSFFHYSLCWPVPTIKVLAWTSCQIGSFWSAYRVAINPVRDLPMRAVVWPEVPLWNLIIASLWTHLLGQQVYLTDIRVFRRWAEHGWLDALCNFICCEILRTAPSMPSWCPCDLPAHQLHPEEPGSWWSCCFSSVLKTMHATYYCCGYLVNWWNLNTILLKWALGRTLRLTWVVAQLIWVLSTF